MKAPCVSESLVSDTVILDWLNISFQINTVKDTKTYQHLYLEMTEYFLDVSKLPKRKDIFPYERK